MTDPKAAPATQPTPMADRPQIEQICYITPEGNPAQFIAGRNCVGIRETEENGEYCTIPWIEVYGTDDLIARFNQHKLEHIIYRRRS